MSRKGNIGQTNIELRNIEALALHEESILWLVIVQGSLRHRIDLLGVEKDQELLSEPQRVLRDAAVNQFQGGHPPERPNWANNAFVYLTEKDAG